MLEILQHDFMIRALVVGIFVAICSAMLGNFVVAWRQAMITDMFAHTALVGVGMGIYLHKSPTYMGILFTFIFALILWFLIRDRKQAPEAISVFLLTGWLAIALLLVHLNKDNPISLDTYLFGSILTITNKELVIFVVLSMIIISAVALLWRQFQMLVFDSEFLKIRSRNNVFYEITFLFLIAALVGIGLKVVGGLLIWALLIAPVLISNLYCQSFRSNVFSSIIYSVSAVIVGIIASFYMDIPTSSSIVLVLIVTYMVMKIRITLKQS